MHPEATIKGKDDFDEGAVPMLPAMNFFEVGFDHPEFRTFFNKEIVPTTDEYTWDFQVIRDNNQPVTISWNNDHFGENANQLY